MRSINEKNLNQNTMHDDEIGGEAQVPKEIIDFSWDGGGAVLLNLFVSFL